MAWILFVLSLFSLSSCFPIPSTPPSGFGTAKHVLIIGCDGFGGMYLENATSFLPNFAKFYSNGATTTRARNQMPSVSAPNWATIITGQGPEESGIQDNNWVSGDPDNAYYMPPISGVGKIPETVWRVAKEVSKGQLTTAAVESWDWIHYLVEEDIVDMEFRGHEDDAACAKALSNMITKSQPNMMFIHFNSIDDAGHSSYWGSTKYYDAVKAVDGYIDEILTALESANIINDTLVIVTADHGGWKEEHDLFNQACVYIPALFMGPGVKKGYTISNYVTNKDFAPTALNALGVPPGKFMVGNIVEEIYKGSGTSLSANWHTYQYC